MIDKFILNICEKIDNMFKYISKLFASKCICKRKKKK